MKQAASQELFSYWDKMRGTRMEPERTELDPDAIRGVLANTFILEVHESLEFPMRVAGTRLATLFTKDVKNQNFISLWDDEAKNSIRDLLTIVLEERSPVLAGVLAAPDGFPPLELELLLLPLRHFGKTHARVIGSLAPCFIPSWLGVVGSPELQLNSMRIVRKSSGLPHSHQPIDSKNDSRTQRFGHLTLLKGGKPGLGLDSDTP